MTNLEIQPHSLPSADDIDTLDALSLTDKHILSVYEQVDSRMQHAPTIDRVQELLDTFEGQECVIAIDTEEDAVVGVANFRYEPRSDQAWIEGLATDVHYQGQGVGKEIVNYIEQQTIARKLAAVALKSVPSAISFYTKLGYDMRDQQSEQDQPVMEKHL